MPLALQNKQIVYGLLFRSSAETLLEIAKDPRHLGAEIGFFSVLHTWNQKLRHHPHVHCVVASGGLSPDHTRWLSPRHPKFFLPESVLSEGVCDMKVEIRPPADPPNSFQTGR